MQSISRGEMEEARRHAWRGNWTIFNTNRRCQYPKILRRRLLHFTRKWRISQT
ncbi:unnamed protein product, partial [Nesidiocoris tenuis]